MKLLHVTTYVPAAYAEEYIVAVSPHIPRLFGHYDHCAWWSSYGTEQFRPLDGANPTAGQIGDVEQIPSVRFEFSHPDDRDALQKLADDVLKPLHPWEEPVLIVTEAQSL